MQPKYQSIHQLLLLIPQPQGGACVQLFNEHRVLFQRTYGSTHNHQAWPGGYYDHVREVMNIAVMLYRSLADTGRDLPFRLTDALLILFLHDLEKPWRIQLDANQEPQNDPALDSKTAHQQFRLAQLAAHGIELNEMQHNALRYVEGEMGDYSSKQRVMNPLAAFCHLADVTSARIWFDYPLLSGDPWAVAGRQRS